MDKREKQVEDIKNEEKISNNAVDEEVKATAQAFARYIKEHGIKPNELSRDEIKEIILKSSLLVAEDGEKSSDYQETEEKATEENNVEVEIQELKEEKKENKKRTSIRNKAKASSVESNSALQKVFAAIINGWDKLQDAVCDFVYQQCVSVAMEYHKTVTTYTNYLKKAGVTMVTVAVLTSAIMLVIEHFTVYEYAYNGRVLGYVDEQTVVTDVLDVAGDHLSKNNNMDIIFSTGNSGDDSEDRGNITFKKTSSEGKTTDDADQVVNKLAYMTDIETVAYGIYEDGKLLTIVKSEGIANSVLNDVRSLESVTDEGMNLVSAKFNKDIEIQQVSVMLSSIVDDNKAVDLLMDGGESKIYHIMNEEETLGSVAKTFGVSTNDIYDGDNKTVLQSYEVGDKVCIRKTTDPVEVEMVESGTMSEVVKYKTIKKKTDKMYKGDTIVKQEGKDGKQVITGTITKINGKTTNRDIDKTEVIKKVQNRIIIVGTAKRPKTEPTGVFGCPLKSNYVITSRVGPRWGSTHEGIDFGISSGTPVYASDGGTVTVAGYSGAYGLLVEIRHNDGYITRYGHCSSVNVKPGDKVYKGQQVSLSGNTGRSTGPHLHFELRKNGTVIDPGPIIGVY